MYSIKTYLDKLMSDVKTGADSIINKTTLPLSGFDEWVPKEYLKDYYTVVEQDEIYTLEFLVNEFKKIKGSPVALEFGIGPTLHHILPLAPYVSEIHVADYLDINLEEIRKWHRRSKDMHNWNPFTKMVLQYEGILDPTHDQIMERENLVRSKLTKFSHCDASMKNPLAGDLPGKYDFVLSCYCADSATNYKDVWENYMENIISLVNHGGFFVTTALRECKFYKVGQKNFPCANVREDDFLKILKRLDFDMSTVNIIVKEVPEHKEIGYESIVLVSGYRK